VTDGAPPEAELVRRLVAGDDGAWRAFVRGYAPLVLALARRMLRQRGARAADPDAEEVVSEVFLQLLRRDRLLLRRYDPRWRLSTYLGVICRTEVLRRVRRERRQGASLAEPAALPEPDTRPGPTARLEETERRETLDALAEGLEGLGARDRLLLTLRFLDGLGYEAIAAALGVSPASVGPLLGRAKARLARRIPQLRGRLPDPSG
jgi:RNA polymerase sigma-70 factor (ECF subfamily)